MHGTLCLIQKRHARNREQSQQHHAALRAGLVRELACAALRHQADLGGADEAAGMPAGWLGDALLRPLLLCALKCALPALSQASSGSCRMRGRC